MGKFLVCMFCRANLETIDHLFCTCPMVEKIWNQWLHWLECPNPWPQGVEQHFLAIPTSPRSNMESTY
uniref:Reverse transcriptase zinc-binding domain-containing protein n=1 Tax=Cajanus cajan TaxID=3821 RepID=A0A151RHG2_CAJCA|nr:hypothetical protein KK1_036613 [Cajanus cajan]